MLHCAIILLLMLISSFASTNQENITETCEEQIFKNVYYFGDLLNIQENVRNAHACSNLCAESAKCMSSNFESDTSKCELMVDAIDPTGAEDSFTAEEFSTYSKFICPSDKSSSREKRQVKNAGCGRSFVSQRLATVRIVGGFVAKPNSFPWIVSIAQRSNHFCGGTIIRVGAQEKSDIVVTAAHCLFNLLPGQISVNLGCTNINHGSCITKDVDKFEIHPQFNLSSASHDIALIKLISPVSFSQTIQPICLQPKKEPSLAQQGTVATAAGWGSIYENGPNSAKLLQVDLPLMDMKKCNSPNFYNGSLNHNVMICAGYPEGQKDSCQGDSGGPLMVKRNDAYFLVGIVSFGEGCARPNYPGVYCNVKYFRDWVDKTVSSLSALALG